MQPLSPMTLSLAFSFIPCLGSNTCWWEEVVCSPIIDVFGRDIDIVPEENLIDEVQENEIPTS